jgi:hypothetical protein
MLDGKGNAHEHAREEWMPRVNRMSVQPQVGVAADIVAQIPSAIGRVSAMSAFQDARPLSAALIKGQLSCVHPGFTRDWNV